MIDRSWDIAEPLRVLNERYASSHIEDIIDPELPIVDPHHHLWDRPPQRYLLDELLVDLNSGHNIVATVFVECTSMWRASGPTEFRPVGETEFAAGVASMMESGIYGNTAVHAGIVSNADLRLGEKVNDAIEAHLAAGGGRLRGIRNRSTFDPLIGEYGPMGPSRGLLLDPNVHAAVRAIGRKGLLFESWQYHLQIPDLVALARKAPDTTIVLDHIGGVLGVGPYAHSRKEIFTQWRLDLAELARCENVHLKIGGLGMSLFGFGLNNRLTPPNSEELALAWRPYVETSIELFGPERCMFESNFPPDLQTTSYRTLWNTFKRLASGYSDAEKAALFSQTANDVYSLNL